MLSCSSNIIARTTKPAAQTILSSLGCEKKSHLGMSHFSVLSLFICATSRCCVSAALCPHGRGGAEPVGQQDHGAEALSHALHLMRWSQSLRVSGRPWPTCFDRRRPEERPDSSEENEHFWDFCFEALKCYKYHHNNFLSYKTV